MAPSLNYATSCIDKKHCLLYCTRETSQYSCFVFVETVFCYAGLILTNLRKCQTLGNQVTESHESVRNGWSDCLW